MSQYNCLSILSLLFISHICILTRLGTLFILSQGENHYFRGSPFTLPMMQSEFCQSKYISTSRNEKKARTSHKPLPLATKLPQLQGAKYFMLFGRLFRRRNYQKKALLLQTKVQKGHKLECMLENNIYIFFFFREEKTL